MEHNLKMLKLLFGEIDKDGKIYRVEFYKSENGKEKFAGMILAEFR